MVKRMLVHLNHTAHHAAIVLKMAVPIRVGQTIYGALLAPMLIGGMKEAAEIRMNPHASK